MERVGTGMDLAYLLRRAGRERPTALAVDDGVSQLATSELLNRSERFANALDVLRLAPGARVGILSENRTEYVEVDLGIALARRVRVALNARLALEDFRYCLVDAGATALVYSAAHRETAAALCEDLGLAPIDLDDTGERGYTGMLAGASPVPVVREADVEALAWITYTSGTTGRPKGVMLSHRAIREVAMNLLLELGPKNPGEGIVLTQALSHGAGYFVLPFVLSGGCIRVLRKFDPEEVVAVSANAALRTLKIVPAMLPPLLELNQTLDFESIVYGASPITIPLLEESLDRFGPVLMQIYGQAECPVTLTLLDKESHLHPELRQSAGRAWRSVAVEIRAPDGTRVSPGEQGEVTVAGAQMMTGYWGLDSVTAEVLHDGWLSTRDMGWADDRGYVHLVGRSDEMINSGGYNVAPREVERVILEHSSVADCAVVGVPDDRWGAAVCAIVCPRGDLDIVELMAFLRERLGFRAPKRIVIAAQIPTNAYGKVDRRRLMTIVEADQA